MQEIFPGLFQVPLTLSGFDPGTVNMYLIKTPHGLTAIDTGWDLPEAVQSLQGQLAEIGAAIPDITEVILTHFHIDHLGLIPRFKTFHPVKVSLHALDFEMMRSRYTGTDNFLPMTDRFLVTHGFPTVELTPPEFQLPMPDNLPDIVPDVLFQGGEEVKVGDYCFRVVHVPGHTKGHVAFYEARRRFIISGDMLLPTIATNAAFHVQHIPNPFKPYLESLAALRQLDCDTVLPGHEHVFHNPQQRIDDLIKNHERKATAVLQALAGGQPKTAYQVSQALAFSMLTGQSHWPLMNGWEKRFAVLQTIAHLEAWEYHQNAVSFEEDEVIYFKTTG